MVKVTVLGAGGLGTAMACILSDKHEMEEMAFPSSASKRG